MNSLDKLHSSDFLPYINQIFRIRLEGFKPIDLELVSVTETGQSSSPGTRAPFSLHFLGPASPQYLAQHIYRLEHEQMGALDLFIVPLGTDKERMRYEAILA